MTSRLLLCALRDRLTAELADRPFPAARGAARPARVYLHGLPREQEEACYPFVVLRWSGGEVSSQADHRVVLRDSVALALGVYSPDSQEEAGLLLAELLDLLRRVLWTTRLLADRFALEEPLKAAIPGPRDRWNEYHLATLETSWNYVWPPLTALAPSSASVESL